MATFFVASETGVDMQRLNLTEYWDGMVSSPTLVEMQNVGTAGGFERLYLVGEGFATGASGWFPVAGVVRRVVYDSDQGVFQIDGLDTPVRDFVIYDPAPQALREALLAGDDTVLGQAGADTLRGYAGNDTVEGYFGADNLHGNLGDDTCDGGEGNDILRGGQQDDVMRGGDGDDFLSGDRDNDTLTGGAGADRFHTFGEAGLDLVTDFRLAEGDRVELDPGTQYTVAQVGADTVISMTGGGQMVLVGVSMAGLTPGWIFGA